MEIAPLSPQPSSLISDFNSATARVTEMHKTYSDAHWQLKPAPDLWSAIECIWHLNWTSEKMIHNICLAMESIQLKTKQGGKYHLDIIGWFLVKSLSMKGRFAKFKTTAPYVSQSTLDLAAVLRRFHELQDEMMQLIQESDGLQLGAGTVESPFNPKVHYNIYSAFCVTAVHQHRHLDQAERAAMAP